MNVLIVDDNEDNRVLQETILTAHGYTIESAVNGVHALRIAARFLPDIIISDILMSKMDGYELCRAVKQDEKLRNIPFVFYTSSCTDSKDKELAMALGASLFLVKPMETEEFLKTIENVLKEHNGGKLSVSERPKLKENDLKQRHEKFLSEKLSEKIDVLKEEVGRRKKVELELRKAHAEVELLLMSIPSILIGVSSEGNVIRWNISAETTFEINSNDVVGLSFRKCGIRWDWDKVVKLISECREKNKLTHLHNIMYKQKNGKDGFLDISITPITGNTDDRVDFLILGIDITKHKIMESQLLQAQKLESIGQLAAGIAHEINTPTQYVSNNIQFLKDTFSEINTLLGKYSSLYEASKKGTITPKLLNEIGDAIKEADVEYLTEETPKAINQSLEGLESVAKIVRSMKDFSHPGTEEKEAIDINKAIESTITVSRNEWKYVANVETDFDSNLPLVSCFPGDFNQVILNIITNAAHAIADVVAEKKTDKGLISIRTRLDGEWVEISMSDSGAGIPEEIRANIFDPFFTTKEIGKGTGQGLAITHFAVVEKHGGTITLHTEVGKGATFIIRLPISASKFKKE